MDKENEIDYAVDLIRMQRHDFMNYLQVIYGYIQINKANEALRYIKDINNKMMLLSRIYNIDSPILSLLLNDFVMKCTEYYIENELYCECDFNSIEFSKDSFKKMHEKFQKVFNRILKHFSELNDDDKKYVLIGIGNKNGYINIIFSNSKAILDDMMHEIDFKNEKQKYEILDDDVFTNHKGNEIGIMMHFYENVMR